MNIIPFLTEKMNEQLKIKALYSSKKNLPYYEEAALKEATKEVDMYLEAIATIKAFNKIPSVNLLQNVS